MSDLGERIGEKHGIGNVMTEDKDIEIFKKMKTMYWSSNTLLDMNNKEYLDELKQYVSSYMKELVVEQNMLSNKKKEEIFKDIDHSTDKMVNKFASKYFNNKARDKMKELQDKWDIAYKNKQYNVLDEI